MSVQTATTPSSLTYRLSSRTLLWLGILAAVISLAAFGYRQLEHSTSYPVPAQVVAVNGDSCTVAPSGRPPDTLTAECATTVQVGDWVAVDYGGLTDQPINAGLPGFALFVACGFGLLAIGTLTARYRRREDIKRVRQLSLTGGAPPDAALRVAGDALDDPVVRDRWRVPPGLPVGTPARIRPRFATFMLVALGLGLVVGGFWVAGALAGAGVPPALALGVTICAAVVVLWRAALRAILWSPEALKVRQFTKTITVPWSEIDHVTVQATTRHNKGGTWWLVMPTLVTVTGGQVPLKPLRRWENGRSIDAARVTTFDTWLDGADVPVDVAYDTYRASVLGTASVQDVLRVIEAGSTGVHPVYADDMATAQPVVTATGPAYVQPAAPDVLPQGAPAQTHVTAQPAPPVPPPRRRGRRARIAGWILLAPALALMALAIPFAIIDVATGAEVDVVVTSVAGDECTVAAVDDAAMQWQADCRPGWSIGDTTTVTIGGQSNEPASWGNVVVATFGLAFLTVPGLVLLLVGYLMGRQPRDQMAGSPA
jgi:hypothetical protein